MKPLKIATVAIVAGIQTYKMYSSYKTENEKYDIEIINTEKVIRTKQVIIKPKQESKHYFIKLKQCGPPTNPANEEYCDKCFLRTKYKCNYNKFFSCPNKHIWFIRNDRVIFQN